MALARINNPWLFETNYEEPTNWPKHSDFQSKCEELFPVYEKIKLEGEEKYIPCFVSENNTADVDFLWIGTPSQIAEGMEALNGNTGVSKKNYEKKDDLNQGVVNNYAENAKKMLPSLKELKNLYFSENKSILNTEDASYYGIVTPFEVFIITNINLQYKLNLPLAPKITGRETPLSVEEFLKLKAQIDAEPGALDKLLSKEKETRFTFKDKFDQLNSLREPPAKELLDDFIREIKIAANKVLDKRQEIELISYVKERRFDMVRHGCDSRSPKPPESLNEPLLHIWKGDMYLTENEQDLIEFVLQPGYLENNFIHVHPQWDMALWAPVIIEQIKLKQPVDEATITGLLSYSKINSDLTKTVSPDSIKGQTETEELMALTEKNPSFFTSYNSGKSVQVTTAEDIKESNKSAFCRIL